LFPCVLQEVVSVLWTLVRLSHIRHLKIGQQQRQLRDALVARYTLLLQAQAQQLQQVMRGPARHAQVRRRKQQQAQQQDRQQQNRQQQPSQQQQQQQDQQQQDRLQQQQREQQQWRLQVAHVIQQMPVFTHAAVLLACARLRVPVHRQLQPGTTKLVCRVSWVGSQGLSRLVHPT
jgi:hypothetical protein